MQVALGSGFFALGRWEVNTLGQGEGEGTKRLLRMVPRCRSQPARPGRGGGGARRYLKARRSGESAQAHWRPPAGWPRGTKKRGEERGFLEFSGAAWDSLPPGSGTQPRAFPSQCLKLASLRRLLRPCSGCRPSPFSGFNSGACQPGPAPPSPLRPLLRSAGASAEFGSGGPGGAGWEERLEVSGAGRGAPPFSPARGRPGSDPCPGPAPAPSQATCAAHSGRGVAEGSPPRAPAFPGCPGGLRAGLGTGS